MLRERSFASRGGPWRSYAPQSIPQCPWTCLRCFRDLLSMPVGTWVGTSPPTADWIELAAQVTVFSSRKTEDGTLTAHVSSETPPLYCSPLFWDTCGSQLKCLEQKEVMFGSSYFFLHQAFTCFFKGFPLISKDKL